MGLIIKFLVMFMLCMLIACTPKLSQELNNKNPKQASAKSFVAKADHIYTWELSGAIAAKNNKHAWSASVNWEQYSANSYKISLFGPLGGGAVLIESHGGAVSYVDGNHKVFARNADELLKSQTGLGLPVHALYYWLQGVAAPVEVQLRQYDSAAHIILMRQLGYSISYLKYINVNGVELPTKIQLEGHGISIKFIINRWRL